MKTAADFRRAELRRKLRRAEAKKAHWRDVIWACGLVTVARNKRAEDLYAYWSDIARILRRTLREDGKGTR